MIYQNFGPKKAQAIINYKKRQKRQKAFQQKRAKLAKYKYEKKTENTAFHHLCNLITQRVEAGQIVPYDRIEKLCSVYYRVGKKITTLIWNAVRWFNQSLQNRYSAYAFYDKHTREIRFRPIIYATTEV